MSAGVGLLLAPEHAWLDRLEPAIAADVDYYSVTPETTWAIDRAGTLQPNSYHRRFASIRARTGRPFVAHSVGMSLGGVHPSELPRRRAFLDRMREDHAVFDFAWWTDHLGLVAAGGHYLALPLPVPHTRAAASAVRDVLASMREVVPAVGLENSALYFASDGVHPSTEPQLIAACLAAPGSHLLLDLHNVLTSARNLGFEPDAYLARLDLWSVIEIHVSGGSDSPPGWLRSGRSMRLDSHDDAVPAVVWDLLARVVPRCPNLRGVTLERMEGTLDAPDVPIVRDELRRIREIVAGARPVRDERAPRRTNGPLTEGSRAEMAEHETALVERLAVDDAPTDGVALASLLVARLRFERLLAGSKIAGELYASDAARFADLFRDYARDVPPPTFFPAPEGALFEAWYTTVTA